MQLLEHFLNLLINQDLLFLGGGGGGGYGAGNCPRLGEGYGAGNCSRLE